MSFKCVSIDEAKALIDKGNITIADVRDADAYLACNIENSINIQQESIEAFLAATDRDQAAFGLLLPWALQPGRGGLSVLIRAIEEVYSMDGGYEAWRAKY